MSLKEDLIAARVRVTVEYDGFTGDVIGSYRTREGKEGVVVQQDATKVVHVYGNSRVVALQPSPSPDEQTEGWARDARQQRVAEWCAAAFGAEHQASVPQRGLRFLEEAIEAYQALGGDQTVAHKLIDYIFAKEPGELSQELGGVGVTLLALAAAAKLSADDAERTEIARVLAKPLEHFWARNKVKNDAGFDATAYPAAAPRSTKGAGE